MRKILALVLACCMMMLVIPAVAESTSTESTDLSGLMDLLGSLGGESTEGSESGMDLSSLAGLLGGSSEGGESSGMDLSSIMGLLGGSSEGGESSGMDLSSIMGLLGSMGGSSEGGESSGMDLSSIMGLLGSMGGSSESGEGGLDLSSLLGSLGGSSEGGEGGFSLGSILGMLGATEAAPVNTVAADNADQFLGTWKIHKAGFSGYEFDIPTLLAKFNVTTEIPAITLNTEGIAFEAEGKEPETMAYEAIDFTDGALNFTIKGAPVKVQLTENGEALATISTEALGMQGEAFILLTPAK